MGYTWTTKKFYLHIAYYNLSHALSFSPLLYRNRPIDWKTSQVLGMHAHFGTNNTIHISLEWLSEHPSLPIFVYCELNSSLFVFCVLLFLAAGHVIQIQLLLIFFFCALDDSSTRMRGAMKARKTKIFVDIFGFPIFGAILKRLYAFILLVTPSALVRFQQKPSK